MSWEVATALYLLCSVVGYGIRLGYSCKHLASLLGRIPMNHVVEALLTSALFGPFGIFLSLAVGGTFRDFRLWPRFDDQVCEDCSLTDSQVRDSLQGHDECAASISYGGTAGIIYAEGQESMDGYSSRELEFKHVLSFRMGSVYARVSEGHPAPKGKDLVYVRFHESRFAWLSAEEAEDMANALLQAVREGREPESLPPAAPLRRLVKL